MQQFELPSSHSARHQNRNVVSLKKVIPLDFQLFNHFKVLKDMFLRTYASSRVKRKSFYRKSELQMFLFISSGHILFTNMASPYKALQRRVKCFGK